MYVCILDKICTQQSVYQCLWVIYKSALKSQNTYLWLLQQLTSWVQMGSVSRRATRPSAKRLTSRCLPLIYHCGGTSDQTSLTVQCWCSFAQITVQGLYLTFVLRVLECSLRLTCLPAKQVKRSPFLSNLASFHAAAYAPCSNGMRTKTPVNMNPNSVTGSTHNYTVLII